MYIVAGCFHSFDGWSSSGCGVIRFDATHALEGAGWAVLQFKFDPPHLCASFDLCRRGLNVQTGYTSTTRGQVAYATRQISKTKSNKRQNTVMLPPQFALKRTGRRSQEFKPTPKYKHMTLFTLLPHIKA